MTNVIELPAPERPFSCECTFPIPSQLFRFFPESSYIECSACGDKYYLVGEVEFDLDEFE